MTNDDTETEGREENRENRENSVANGRRMFRTGFITGLIGLLPVTAGSGYLLRAAQEEPITTVANRAALSLYDFGNVGNDGKMDKTTEEMYQNMGRVFCAVLNMPKQNSQDYFLIGLYNVGRDGIKRK